ncbi:WD repeat-containing protein 65 [Oceanobacillus picturae]|uniref:WD repeat-containing protein 65 n=1 Tax=Oceanobacillus picturae TaxID=171693 RepID=A0A0U9H5N0_9BACI|nr:hypothetical protein [Oceanobacillus picturae]GAQ18026.1 WD repeat-containing protein 65 [Oceanobacillus picturae]
MRKTELEKKILVLEKEVESLKLYIEQQDKNFYALATKVHEMEKKNKQDYFG